MRLTQDTIESIPLEPLAQSKRYYTRCLRIAESFYNEFPQSQGEILVSAPGRVEIGGNHTDHQRGCVVAAAIDLDTLGVAAPNGSNTVNLISEGYPPCTVELSSLSALDTDAGSTSSLIRGIADGFARRGFKTGGFNACIQSDVLNGSGLSSSAAFEVWLGTATNHLFNNGTLSPLDIAQIGQYAENEHFGKPSGLEDQMASAYGGIVFIDFQNDPPVVERIKPRLDGYTLCIIDSGADHAGLTHAYASITDEMRSVSRFFGKDRLRQVDHDTFIRGLSGCRAQVGDRAVLRAMHFFGDNRRAVLQADALKAGDLGTFLRLVKESGRSSYMYLQNVILPGTGQHQELALALAMCEHLLDGRGAFRVQGGGFAGTVEAFVPNDILSAFRSGIEAVFGLGSCHVLSIRQSGARRLV